MKGSLKGSTGVFYKGIKEDTLNHNIKAPYNLKVYSLIEVYWVLRELALDLSVRQGLGRRESGLGLQV